MRNQTKNMIGSARFDGLYLLDQFSSVPQALIGDNKDINREIIQWHRRTRMTCFLFKSKSDVFSCFRSFHKLITQFDAKTSCPSTSAQNGVIERKNQHLLEVARSLMFTMNLPKPY
ncbi:gag-pol polyprotein [Gossypium australe]|uniref:Gag-pol polyprotein n=1 Tax=Gossypium australe TaxID=47621 RepID=A0A5B6WTB6_9ROSI|nr:gag-pol polyprotein [Gossypium australe]